MLEDQRFKEICEGANICPTELKFDRVSAQGLQCFEGGEYYLIIHLTNAELYYLDNESKMTFEISADLKENTPKGKIYCFK